MNANPAPDKVVGVFALMDGLVCARYFSAMAEEPDSLTLRMLSDMRDDHAATREAVEAHMRAIGRMFDNVGSLIDRLDAIEARLVAFQAETGKTLRTVQSDVIAMENQKFARHGETINLVNRMRRAEEALADVVDSDFR